MAEHKAREAAERVAELVRYISESPDLDGRSIKQAALRIEHAACADPFLIDEAIWICLQNYRAAIRQEHEPIIPKHEVQAKRRLRRRRGAGQRELPL